MIHYVYIGILGKARTGRKEPALVIIRGGFLRVALDFFSASILFLDVVSRDNCDWHHNVVSF